MFAISMEKEVVVFCPHNNEKAFSLHLDSRSSRVIRSVDLPGRSRNIFCRLENTGDNLREEKS